MSLDALQAMLRVSVEGIFIVSRAVLPRMIARRSGPIVNLASSAGKTGNANFTGYSVSKFAAIGPTQAMASETAAHGIRGARSVRGPSWTPQCGRRSRHNNGVTGFPKRPSAKNRCRSDASRCLQTRRESRHFSRRTMPPT
ncbi:MAG: SDR family NAD(P)-dependent oxidoreductase [Alphaproteobacteria bacterium]|nr:SDR family NAD(P)-dependent oxidoreductase [Alphaproteobacteria bacterium]